MGVPARINKTWSAVSIHKITYSEFYATGQYETSLDGKKYITTCPPIISMDMWRRAEEQRQANKTWPSRNVKEDYLCRGLVTCPCGWKWTALASATNKKYPNGHSGFYNCVRKDHQPEQRHADCPGTIGSRKLDKYVWDFVVRIAKNPTIVQEAIDKKIKKLQAEDDSSEQEAEHLQHELDGFTQQRQWVITQARLGRITYEDMDYQLAALHVQGMDLRKQYNEAIAATAVKSKGEELKEWAERYLHNMAEGLRVLDTPPNKLAEEESSKLYEGLTASRFEEKYNGDKSKALAWAIFEERRKAVRAVISSVLVVKGKNNEKLVIPQLVFTIPAEFESLLYDDQSLEYIESSRKLLEEEAKAD